MEEQPVPSRIINIADAPLPTPDPWAADGPWAQRCPACALFEPGEQRCRRCKTRLAFQRKSQVHFSANLANLCVVLIGCRPMLLIIGALFRNPNEPLINPFLIYLAITLPVAALLGGLLFFRITWAWYGALVFSITDMIAQLTFQLLVPRPPVVPIAGFAADLIITGLLLTVFDEVRKETLLVAMPPDHALPKTPLDLYNRGVEYSHKHLWYLAARMWQRAVALANHEARYRRALGLAYLRLNEHTAAEAELRASLVLEPHDQRAQELLEMAITRGST
jgi:hypothetical protein